METSTEKAGEKEIPLLKRLRNSVLPVKESDPVWMRTLKNSGFILFAIMFGSVSLLLVTAIAFVL
ncbi:hypothetical protein [Chitinophaga sp. Cy-1792]|uniref:hypothetical protein n=1 Tax=Chitinophaga sp. Cy-1792 TaxID=2608339 RepID=UPI00141EA788|nr:hypothetical protein [Chitinophaga sp. Cy-1792]NIG54034.1 hypothetical protein [Chitinophaga sp. Cy-1792]